MDERVENNSIRPTLGLDTYLFHASQQPSPRHHPRKIGFLQCVALHPESKHQPDAMMPSLHKSHIVRIKSIGSSRGNGREHMYNVVFKIISATYSKLIDTEKLIDLDYRRTMYGSGKWSEMDSRICELGSRGQALERSSVYLWFSRVTWVWMVNICGKKVETSGGHTHRRGWNSITFLRHVLKIR